MYNRINSATLPIISILLTVCLILVVAEVVKLASDKPKEESAITIITFSTSIYELPESYAKEIPLTSDSETFLKEVDAIALTLAGECYDDKLDDKRGVAEVIVNRVSDGGFGDSVMDVLSAEGQFCGYWEQSRPISESDIRIATEILDKWYSNNRNSLSEYLYFCAGSDRENIFRVDF